MTMTSFTARAQVARYSGTESGWSITIEDADAGIRVLDLVLTDEQFGRLIGGSVKVHAKVNLDSARVGKRLEVRRERVPLSKDQAYDREHFAVNLAFAATDHQRAFADLWPKHGWRARLDEKFNQHRYDDDGYEVVFERWVEKEDVS